MEWGISTWTIYLGNQIWMPKAICFSYLTESSVLFGREGYLLAQEHTNVYMAKQTHFILK